jgi:hypothetical protein
VNVWVDIRELVLIAVPLKANTADLIHPLGPRNPRINRLAPGKSFFDSMPVRDSFLPQLPAQENLLPLDLAGKIQQSYTEILHLHSHGIDFGKRIFGTLLGAGPFTFSPRQWKNLEKHPAIQENAVMQGLHLGIDLVHQFLGLDRRAQQGFKNWQQSVRFVKGKSAVRHRGKAILTQPRVTLGSRPRHYLLSNNNFNILSRSIGLGSHLGGRRHDLIHDIRQELVRRHADRIGSVLRHTQLETA